MKKILLIASLIINSCLGIHDWEIFDIQTNKCFPWHAKTFISKLKTWNVSSWNVFEWSSKTRHSFLWWSSKCKHFTTTRDIDPRDKKNIHNQILRHKIVTLNLKNVTYKERLIDVKKINHPFFGKIETNPFTTRGTNTPYVEAINENNELYDCIIIDGYHPTACASHALKHIKPGGIIILNNANRLSIGIDSSEIFELLKTYKRYEFDDGNDNTDRRTVYWVIN